MLTGQEYPGEDVWLLSQSTLGHRLGLPAGFLVARVPWLGHLLKTAGEWWGWGWDTQSISCCGPSWWDRHPGHENPDKKPDPGRDRGLQRADTFPLVWPRPADVLGTLQASVYLSEVL